MWEWTKRISFTISSVLSYMMPKPLAGSTFTTISAPAQALGPVIVCHLKLYYNSSTIRNTAQWRFFFFLASSKFKLLLKFYFGSGSRSQIISAPEHWFWYFWTTGIGITLKTRRSSALMATRSSWMSRADSSSPDRLVSMIINSKLL